MCTAISINGKAHLFGRTLDVERSYGEAIVVTPRRAPLKFRHESTLTEHPAIIGMGLDAGGFPLYFDAVNEHGLAAAGLNFPYEAVYTIKKHGAYNVASFELIPWLLANAKSVDEARALLEKANVTDDSFSVDMPTTPLHFMISDKSGSIVAEPAADGLKLYDNPVGVMTNSPEFPFHLKNAAQYEHLTSAEPLNENIALPRYSKGFGAIGLPGDFSSPSRFVRALFAKNNTDASQDEVGRFFHITDTVNVPMGCEKNADGKSSFTAYTCCIDTGNAVYHYTTYDRREIRRGALADTDTDADALVKWEIK